MAEDRALYNANDGLTGRDGGPYLDQQEDINAEIRRAKVEDREPDLDNPPASAGTVLVTAGQALANAGVNNLPSQSDNANLGAEATLKALSEDEGNALRQRSVVPAEGITPEESPVDLSMRTALADEDTRKEISGTEDKSDASDDETLSSDEVFDTPVSEPAVEGTVSDAGVSGDTSGA